MLCFAWAQRIYQWSLTNEFTRPSDDPIQCIANRPVADWIEGVTHPRDDDRVGIGHICLGDTEGKAKGDEMVISSMDDGEGYSACHSLRHGPRRLGGVPLGIDPHVTMPFRNESAQFGPGQNHQEESAYSKRYSPIGRTRHDDDSGEV